MSGAKRRATYKGAHSVVRGSLFSVIWYDEYGKRHERRTSIPASQPDAITEYIYKEFIAPDHKPTFGTGDPAQVKLATVLNEYWIAKQQESEHKVTLRLTPIKVALRNLEEFIGERFVADWTDDLNAKYVEWRTKHGVATTTASNDLLFLRAALNYCVKKSKLQRAPRIELPFRPANRHPRHLSERELALLLWGALGWDRDGVRRHRPHYALTRFLLIGAFTGTRADRILRLQRVENLHGGWVDLAKGRLHRKAAHEPETKKKAPTVALPPMPRSGAKRNKLRAHFERWDRHSDAHIIEGRHGGPLTDAAIQKHLEIVCQRMGVNAPETRDEDRVTPHTLRHTCATWLIESGLSCVLVGKYIGASEGMVERTYSHSSDESERATAAAFGREKIRNPAA